jgi:hypothetical protein
MTIEGARDAALEEERAALIQRCAIGGIGWHSAIPYPAKQFASIFGAAAHR